MHVASSSSPVDVATHVSNKSVVKTSGNVLTLCEIEVDMFQIDVVSNNVAVGEALHAADSLMGRAVLVTMP